MFSLLSDHKRSDILISRSIDFPISISLKTLSLGEKGVNLENSFLTQEKHYQKLVRTWSRVMFTPAEMDFMKPFSPKCYTRFYCFCCVCIPKSELGVTITSFFVDVIFYSLAFQLPMSDNIEENYYTLGCKNVPN